MGFGGWLMGLSVISVYRFVQALSPQPLLEWEPKTHPIWHIECSLTPNGLILLV